MSKDFYSFERVLRELQMEEEELKRLVSEGEIRAFRDQDKMKFKKEEVERFKSLKRQDSSPTEQEVPEELVFDEDDADQEVGMATAAIADDSFLAEDEEKLELEEAPAATGGRSRPAPSTARKPRVVVDEPEETEGPLWKSVILAITVVALMGAFVGLDAVRSMPSSLSNGIMRWVGGTFCDIQYRN